MKLLKIYFICRTNGYFINLKTAPRHCDYPCSLATFYFCFGFIQYNVTFLTMSEFLKELIPFFISLNFVNVYFLPVPFLKRGKAYKTFIEYKNKYDACNA